MAAEGEDIELRSQLDEKFRPLFREHEEHGGLPLRVLRSKLDEYGAGENLPPGKLELLIQRADQDRDGVLDYDEFIQLMTSKKSRLLDHKQLTRFQKLVRASVSTVIPGSAQNKDGEPLVDDYISQYNCRPPPLFMILISVAEIIVFIVYAVQLNKTSTPVTATSGVPFKSPLIFNPYRRYEAWRYLTYMFIHQGYLHLIFNLLFQLTLGLPLEMVHKWWRVGIVYCLGVIAGSLAHTVVDGNVYLAGASGGCYSLIGAHFAIVIMNWKEMTHGWMEGPVRFVLSAPVRLIVFGLIAGIDTGISIWNRYNGTGQNIGYAAHFGGALAGLLIGIPVLKNLKVKPWERIVWWVSLIIYLVAVMFAVCWNAFYPGFPPTDWKPCCD